MQHSGEFEITNAMGLHARPASEFVRTAGRFVAEIMVEKDGDVVNGKSIMSLLMLSAGAGSILRITAEGPDAEEAVRTLGELIGSRFNENH